jgi:hypothetical protein
MVACQAYLTGKTVEVKLAPNPPGLHVALKVEQER